MGQSELSLCATLFSRGAGTGLIIYSSPFDHFMVPKHFVIHDIGHSEISNKLHGKNGIRPVL